MNRALVVCFNLGSKQVQMLTNYAHVKGDKGSHNISVTCVGIAITYCCLCFSIKLVVCHQPLKQLHTPTCCSAVEENGQLWYESLKPLTSTDEGGDLPGEDDRHHMQLQWQASQVAGYYLVRLSGIFW